MLHGNIVVNKDFENYVNNHIEVFNMVIHNNKIYILGIDIDYPENDLGEPPF